MWSTERLRPRFAANFTSARASREVVAIGFSTITAFPASSACRASEACERLLVATNTASTAESLSTSAASRYHVSPSASAAFRRLAFTSVAPTNTACFSGLKRAVSQANPSFAIRFSAIPPNPISAYLTRFIPCLPLDLSRYPNRIIATRHFSPQPAAAATSDKTTPSA
jgi:hypothetical protein